MFQKLKSYTAFFLVATAFIAASGISLFSDGMFMDGTIYAAISHNMANGLGSFWQPHLSQTLYPEFYQHPPLALGLEALAFKIFGDSFLIERFYSLTTFIISACLIVLIWIEIGKPKNKAWIPLLFWFANPLVIWAVANNMLENTLQIFVLAAVWTLIKSLKTRTTLWILFGGIFLFLGLLTKGLVALFPLSFYFWYWILQKDILFSKMMLNTALLILFTITPLILLLILNEQAFYALQSYFNKQIITSIKDVQTVASRFFIVGRLFNELLSDFGIFLLISLIFKKNFKHLKTSFQKNRTLIYLFLGLGFSGVLPIMISLKQSGFYMLPAFPFFALAFGLITLPLLENIANAKLRKSFIFKYSGILSLLLLLIAFSATFSFKNKIGRDKDMLEDIYSINAIVPNNEMIDIPKNLSQNWPLQAYFARYSYISLNDVSKKPHRFYLCKKGSFPRQTDSYSITELDLKKFSLFKLKSYPAN
ncbi:MAG: hypothetical protein DRI74_02505 [Bacteroidetes bacterium]|nr:MAG: hypothetical protein DRI74_02505 [Bacteroidota bacterium]